jgi:NDP-sugar pyrophosphorylase family protein
VSDREGEGRKADPVKAFVLAGGLGTRLRPRFGDLPKGLAPLGNRPFLERPIEWLVSHGIRSVVLCVGHGADQVEATLGDGSRLGAAITYSPETEPLGTGGALANAARHARGPALVLNGDTLVTCDPWQLERARWETAALGAIALFEWSDPGSKGRVETDDRSRITRFVEKDPAHRGPTWVNGGLYAFSPHLWSKLPDGPSSLERDVLPKLAAEGLLLGVRMPGTFFDIGTPEEHERAERRLV